MENTPGHSALRHSGVCPHMTTRLRNSFVSLVSFCQVEKVDLYFGYYEHPLRTKEGADGGGTAESAVVPDSAKSLNRKLFPQNQRMQRVGDSL